jgi:tRNA(Ile)-lysidine synthetase, N-terminal domain
MKDPKFQATIWQTLINFAKENKFFKPKDKILVGLSGGADSVALLHFVCQLAKKQQFFVYACHVDHQLRANSKQDAIFAKDYAKSLGVECFVKKVNVKTLAKKEKKSLEHAARTLRYKAFEDAAKKFNCSKIALAHHADDNAETFFLNILRGTKAKGLCGIPVMRKAGKRQIIRPFLCITREQIKKYLKQYDLKNVEDETNREDIYLRNWIRLKLLPLMLQKQPLLKEHILSITKELSNELK